jgi:hypothetical protein
MIADLERRLDAVCESFEASEAEFNQATKCLVESLQGIHLRLERIEKWILDREKAPKKD